MMMLNISALVNTIALTKPDKAKQVEYMLAQMARSGQIQEKVWLNHRLYPNFAKLRPLVSIWIIKWAWNAVQSCIVI